MPMVHKTAAYSLTAVSDEEQNRMNIMGKAGAT